MRTKVELTEKESKLIAGIPSAKKAIAIWAKFEARTKQAREDRHALGVELIAVRKALGTKGMATGCTGLFHRWLRTQGISHTRAYGFMGLAGGAKPQTKRKSYLRAKAFITFQSRLCKATANAEKVGILSELVEYVKAEYGIKGGK